MFRGICSTDSMFGFLFVHPASFRPHQYKWQACGKVGLCGKRAQPWLTMTGSKKIALNSCNHILGART